MSKTAQESVAVNIPFTVRMEPYLVESICELSRLVRDKGHLHTDISGLLFGKSEPGTRTVEALKTFADVGTHSDLARRERLEKAYRTAVEEAKGDPELSALDVVGCFSFRNGSGLLSSDVVFHNQHFRKPEDLSLIIWREGPSQITAEFYSRNDNNSLTSDDYRWGSVRLSADIRHMHEPVDLAMRVKLADDSYLRTYDSDEPESQFASIMRRAEAVTERLFGFLHKRKDEEYTQKVRGLIGDGSLPNPANWPPEATGSQIPTPHAYLNPYAEASAKAMNRLSMAEIGKPAPAPAWPGLSTGFATGLGAASAPAPARTPDLARELAPNDPRKPLSLAVPPLDPAHDLSRAGDFSRVGQSPRTRLAHPEISGLPMVLHPRQAPRKASPWPWAAALFVITSAAVFAFLLLGGLQNDGGRLGQTYHALFPGGDLNLRVGTDDDRLRLTWNQRNPAVASATDGTLQIIDGQQHRQVHLDGRQVADGLVLYRPLTNDVTFRLEVRGEQGGVAGSVRVLDGLGDRQPLDVSAPSSQPDSHQAAPQNLQADSSLSALKDPGSPTLLRPEMASDQGVPITDAPVVPVPARPLARTSAVRRYETPQTVGTYSDTPTSTINGWDSYTPNPRSKARTSSRTAKLATAGSGYVGPRPLMQVMPKTSTIPSGTIQSRTRVEVQVRVDPAGRVAAAQVVGAGANQAIESAALAAARQWTFEPASSNGQHVESQHTIVFEFRPQHQ